MPYLEKEEFLRIFSKVPRLTIDLVIQSEEGVLLALRAIEPCEGLWHLPGGSVFKGETIEKAAKRIAKGETGLSVSIGECLGYIEFPDEKRGDITTHSVSIALKATPQEGDLRPDENAKELRYFKVLPKEIISQHGEFLKKNLRI